MAPKNRMPPKHVAIIMDGNGRWGERIDGERTNGHQAGARRVRPVVEAAAKAGVDFLTLWAFSSDNWKRPDNEVNAILGLVSDYLLKEVSAFLEGNIRLNFIGDLDGLPGYLKKAIELTRQQTAANTGLTLTVALNYGGQDDILQAVHAAVERGEKPTKEEFAALLWTHDMSSPDLVIRTSGEYRSSGFMPWETAHAEWVYTSKLWPDFTPQDFQAALTEYAGRARRFGGLELVEKRA